MKKNSYFIKLTVILGLMSSLSGRGEDYLPLKIVFFTNYTIIGTNEVPIVVTNEKAAVGLGKPREMLLELSYFPTWRSESYLPNTNGSVEVRVSGPNLGGYPHWVGGGGYGAFKVLLRDDRGVSVEPTEIGRQLGKAPKKVRADRLKSNNVTMSFLGLNLLFDLIYFDIDDMFVIHHSGNYKLQMTPQCYWQAGPGPGRQLTLTNLPPIEMTIPLKSNDGSESK